MINAWAFLNYWGHVSGLPPKSTLMYTSNPRGPKKNQLSIQYYVLDDVLTGSDYEIPSRDNDQLQRKSVPGRCPDIKFCCKALLLFIVKFGGKYSSFECMWTSCPFTLNMFIFSRLSSFWFGFWKFARHRSTTIKYEFGKENTLKYM